jgi:hypothetical protein
MKDMKICSQSVSRSLDRSWKDLACGYIQWQTLMLALLKILVLLPEI